jgi:hypothetical protein
MLIIIVALTFCDACVNVSPFATLRRGGLPEQVDISTSNATAIIKGTVDGLFGYDCWILRPTRARSIMTDAGEVMVVVECIAPSGDAGNSAYAVYSRAAVLEFRTVAGHVYEVLSYDSGNKLGFGHLEVHDQNTEESFVIRAPLVRVNVLIRQVSNVPHGWTTNRALLVRSGCLVQSVVGAAKDQWPAMSSSQLQFAILRKTNAHVLQAALSLVPGTVTMAVDCHKTKKVYSAGISFEAKAGRLYRIDLQDQDHHCIRIMDVSDRVFEVVCVPVTASNLDH